MNLRTFIPVLVFLLFLLIFVKSETNINIANSNTNENSNSRETKWSLGFGRKCFPSSATVQLQGGTFKKMSEVAIGDKVLVNSDTYSEVFAFTHKDDEIRTKFLNINLANGASLPLTSGHYLYVNEKGNQEPARNVKPGWFLFDKSGSKVKVLNVVEVTEVGLYNPQTIHGDIVVNGIISTTFTEAIPSRVAQTLLSPIRMMYKLMKIASNLLS